MANIWDDLPRVFELKAFAEGSGSTDAYPFDHIQNPLALKCWRDIEKELQGLDLSAWEHLKKEVKPALISKHDLRGWQSVFDTLNEARAFNYMHKIGCTRIRFVPRSPQGAQKSPDFEGLLNGRQVLCEVKTINTSQAELELRRDGCVRSTLVELRPEFFNKLQSVLDHARSQLGGWDHTKAEARKIIYVVFNFDDSLNEYVDEYQKKIEPFLATRLIDGIEVVTHFKPPFYSATM